MEMLEQSLQLLLEKLQGWGEGLVLGLPNLLLALLVVVIFFYIARFVKKFCYQGLYKFSHNTVISGLLSAIAEILILGTGFFVALEVLQLSKVVTSLLAGAGIVGLAMGIAFQDFVANIISGIFFAVKKPLHVGDTIETSGIFGVVKEMGLRSTIVDTAKGQYVYIPNREIFQNPLYNYSKTKKRRVDLEVGVSYDGDLEDIRTIAIEAIQTVPEVLEKKPVELFYTSFGDSSINFVVRFWIKFDRQRSYRHATSEAIIAVKKAFDKEGISIPFPIRTLDIDMKELGTVFKRK